MQTNNRAQGRPFSETASTWGIRTYTHRTERYGDRTMLMVAIITWGGDFVLQQVASREEVVRLKKALNNGSGPKRDRDFVFHEGNLLCPVTLDRTHRQLSKDEVIEFLRGEAWPKLVEEGRIKMKNGKPILIREDTEQPQSGGVTVTQALRDAFG